MFPGGMKPCHEERQTHDNREENGFAFLRHFDVYLIEFLLKEQRTFFFTEMRCKIETKCANPWSVCVKFLQ